MKEFIAMGGYGIYVWPAYALALVVLVSNWVVARRRHREVVNTLRARMGNES